MIFSHTALDALYLEETNELTLSHSFLFSFSTSARNARERACVFGALRSIMSEAKFILRRAAVRIWFTEAIEPAFSSIQVLDTTGKQIDKKDTHLDSGQSFAPAGLIAAARTRKLQGGLARGVSGYASDQWRFHVSDCFRKAHGVTHTGLNYVASYHARYAHRRMHDSSVVVRI